MNIAVLKSDIKKQIDIIEDESILLEAYKLLGLRSYEEELYNLSNKQLEKIQKSINQIENREYKDHKDVNEGFEKWLNE